MKTRQNAPRQARQHFECRRLEGLAGLAGEKRRQDGSVGGVAVPQLTLDIWVPLVDQLEKFGGVGQVAVVTEGYRSAGGAAESRLRVLPAGRARGRVAAVADGEVPREAAQCRLVEHLGDEAHVLVNEDLVAVAGRDTGRLLAAVLQCVKAEIAELGDLLAGRPDPEYTTGVLRPLLPRKKVMT
jgi:hypothetical protein